MSGLESTMTPCRLSDIASRYGVRLAGDDREIVTLGAVDSPSAHRARMLTYVLSRRWLEDFTAGDIAAAVVPETMAHDVPDGASVLVTSGDPEALFFAILTDTAEDGQWTRLAGAIGDGAIDPSAVIEEGVIVGNGCRIMAGAVLLSNTRLGDRVLVKPHATIGSEGF